MKVLITGDRNWKDKRAVRTIIDMCTSTDLERGIHETVVIHGCAIGADSIAGLVAKKLRLTVKEHPANWDEYGRAAGPIRNSEMLKEKPDICFGFHNDIKNSKGTKDMLKKAKKAGIPTYLISTEF